MTSDVVMRKKAMSTASVCTTAALVTPMPASSSPSTRAIAGSPSQPIATPTEVIASWMAETWASRSWTTCCSSRARRLPARTMASMRLWRIVTIANSAATKHALTAISRQTSRIARPSAIIVAYSHGAHGARVGGPARTGGKRSRGAGSATEVRQGRSSNISLLPALDSCMQPSAVHRRRARPAVRLRQGGPAAQAPRRPSGADGGIAPGDDAAI